MSCDSFRVLYWTSFLDRFPRKHDEKAWALVKCFNLVRIGGKFQNGGNDTIRKAFFKEKKGCRRRTTLFTDMDNEMSKKRFTEELSFETEVAQAAALSAILLSKKQRQARGLDELRINNWWSQGH